jgi:hypothetical protein
MATATRSRKAPAKTAAPAPKRTTRAKTAPPAKATAKAAPAAKRGRPKASADKKGIAWLSEHLESAHGIEADGTKIRQALRQLVNEGTLEGRVQGSTYEFTGLKDPQVVELIKKLKSGGRKKATAPKRGRKAKAEPVDEIEDDVEDLDDEEEYEDADDEELEDDEEYEDEDEDLDDE